MNMLEKFTQNLLRINSTTAETTTENTEHCTPDFEKKTSAEIPET